MMALNNFNIPENSLNVRANFKIESKELSGQTSGSDRSEEGIKPCTLSVSLKITFDKYASLTRLRDLATAQTDTGNLQVYDIVNETAAAMKVRQVTFIDNFSVSEVDGQKAWQVNFTLAEYQSIPEKTEQRQPQPAAKDQFGEGETAGEVAPPANSEEQLSMGYRILKKMDEALA